MFGEDTAARLEALEERLVAVRASLRAALLDVDSITREIRQLSEAAGDAALQPQGPPGAPTAKAAPAERNRFYCVLAGRTADPGFPLAPVGQAGLYNTYTAYANAVCSAESFPHSGRGSLDFATGSRSQAFARVSEAYDHWNEVYPTLTVTRHW